MDNGKCKYYQGFQLDDVRKLTKKGLVNDPVIVHKNNCFTFYFDLNTGSEAHDKCVLITVKGARPREFKKAKTYTRILKDIGINRWRVINKQNE